MSSEYKLIPLAKLVIVAVQPLVAVEAETLTPWSNKDNHLRHEPQGSEVKAWPRCIQPVCRLIEMTVEGRWGWHCLFTSLLRSEQAQRYALSRPGMTSLLYAVWLRHTRASTIRTSCPASDSPCVPPRPGMEEGGGRGVGGWGANVRGGGGGGA